MTLHLHTTEDNPQEVINEQVVSKSDILLGVFWSKLGTPTNTHSSGTIEEIIYFISQGKEVIIILSIDIFLCPLTFKSLKG